jgi:hypothetical protein
VRGGDLGAVQREVAAALDVDHEVILGDDADRADLFATLFEEDLIADLDVERVLRHAVTSGADCATRQIA